MADSRPLSQPLPAPPASNVNAVPADATAPAVHPTPLVYAGLWLVNIAWGGSFVAARVLLHATAPGQVALSPTILAATRFSLAALFFLIPLARAIHRRQLSLPDLLRLVALGQLTYSIYFWLQYTGVQQTNASVSSILVVGLAPLATALFSWLLARESLSAFKIAALLLGLAGVVVVALQQGLTLSRDTGFLLGSLALVGNALAFALYSTLSKRWMRTISPTVMTGGTMLSGALGLILLSLLNPTANRWSDVTRLDPAQVAALLFLILFCSVGAYFTYNFALTRMPAARAAVYIYFEPVVAIALGILLLGERLTLPTILGALLITASIFLVHLRR